MSVEALKPALPAENRWALIIGVNSAPDAQDCDLHPELMASQDAEAIATLLEGEHCGFKLFAPPLLGEHATSEAIRKTLRRFGRDRNEDDFLLLYFAGHGYPINNDIYLVTHDFEELDISDDPQAHLSLSWLRDRFYFHTGAHKVLLILDCCYAGNIMRTPALLRPGELLERFKQHVDELFGIGQAGGNYRPDMFRMALTAAAYGQTAGEGNTHGLMTEYLLKALSGEVEDVIDVNDRGHVKLNLIYNYLQREMRGRQLPNLPGDPGGKECVLANYEDIAEKIRQRKRATGNERPNTYIALPRLTSFQQRPHEFITVTELLLDGDSAEHGPRRVVGLIGIGGTGKSYLTAELAYRFIAENRFPAAILWLSVTSSDQEALQEQLADLCEKAEYLPPSDDVTHPENSKRRARHLCRYLARHPDSLLILDNIDDIDETLTSIHALIGEEFRCTILYTSRNPNTPVYVSPYTVEKLTDGGARNLLLEYRPELLALVLANDQGVEADMVRTICNHVENLPLAVTLLRDLLQEKMLTLSRLWEEQNIQGTLAITRGTEDILKARLFRTFEQSWQRVTTDHARQLFKLATYFPEAAPIPLWLPGLAAGLTGESPLEPLGQARQELKRWSLIEVLPDGETIRLHPLIREFGQLLEQADPLREDWLALAEERLLTEFTDINRLEQRALAKGYWTCLRDVQAVLNYTHLLNIPEQTIEAIGQWLTQDSSLLGETSLWPKQFPTLFYQQFYNHAIEEGYTLPGAATDAPWLRQQERVGATDQALLLQLQHPHEVNSVAFSPDGRQALTACYDGIVRLWDATTGRLLQEFRGHTDSVLQAVFSPDGQTIATCSADGTARLWEVASGKEIYVFREHKARVTRITFAPDGSKLASTSDDEATCVWDVASRELLTYLAINGTDVVFSPDSKNLVTSTVEGVISLCGIDDAMGIATLLEAGEEVSSLSFSQDGRYLLVGLEQLVLIHDMQNTLPDKRIPDNREHLPGWLNAAALSPDGNFVTVGFTNQVAKIWNIHTGELYNAYRHKGAISDLAFSSDGTRVITGSYDYTARIWRVYPQPQSAICDPDDRAIFNAPFLPMHVSETGTLLRISMQTGLMNRWQIQLWNIQRKELLASLPLSVQGVHAPCANFSFQQDSIIIGILNGLFVWNTDQREPELVIISNLQTTYRVLATLKFTTSTHNQSVIAGMSDETIRIWNLHTKQLTHTLVGHRGGITCIVLSPDNSKFITAATDSTAIIWDSSTYQRVFLRGHIGTITRLGVSPDSSLLATGDLNGTIYLWSLHDGRLLSTFQGHRQRITALSFSPDGRLLVSCDLSSRVFICPVQLQGELAPQGIYTAPHEIGAVFWHDNRQLTLIDSGGTEDQPHFYRLTLEGPW